MHYVIHDPGGGGAGGGYGEAVFFLYKEQDNGWNVNRVYRLQYCIHVPLCFWALYGGYIGECSYLGEMHIEVFRGKETSGLHLILIHSGEIFIHWKNDKTNVVKC